MSDVPEFTVEQKLKCVTRELAMRMAVYPGQVRRGTMKQEEMDHEIDCMRAIRQDYVEQAVKKDLEEQPPLPL